MHSDGDSAGAPSPPVMPVVMPIAGKRKEARIMKITKSKGRNWRLYGLFSILLVLG